MTGRHTAKIIGTYEWQRIVNNNVKTMKNMKCLTNKWREGAMLLSFLLISSLAGIFTACDDIEDEYITDTQLSILQENRTSLNYLLKTQLTELLPAPIPKPERIY